MAAAGRIQGYPARGDQSPAIRMASSGLSSAGQLYPRSLGEKKRGIYIYTLDIHIIKKFELYLRS